MLWTRRSHATINYDQVFLTALHVSRAFDRRNLGTHRSSDCSANAGDDGLSRGDDDASTIVKSAGANTVPRRVDDTGPSVDGRFAALRAA
ncbi:hypothetical protein Aduo_017694 [Ancylostoma duodenale]